MTWINREAATEMNPEPRTLCRLVVPSEDKETIFSCYLGSFYSNLLLSVETSSIRITMKVWKK